MKYLKVTLLYNDSPQGSYTGTLEEALDSICELLRNGWSDGNDAYKLEVVEMTEAEFEKLPEFSGF